MEEKLKKIISDALNSLYPQQKVSVFLETPANKDFGDYATNVAMVLAKPLKKNPREIAQSILEALKSDESFIKEISIAGPGFLNFKLHGHVWLESLGLIQSQADAFGVCQEHQGKKVLVEFVSANPTGPLHIGHGRNAVVGDTLARLLQAVGYSVDREYYINDGGIQIQTLGLSTYLRYQELKGEKIEFPETCYQGDYIKDLARELLEDTTDYDSWEKDKIIEHFGHYSGDHILEEIKEDLKNIGVEFDAYFRESSLYENGLVETTLKKLEKAGYLYEKDGALWLASTKHGDDKDRVLKKSEGLYTYLTPDIAYHQQKFERGYDMMINVLGADHGGYIARLKAAIEGLGYDSNRVKVVLIQMVSLIKGGEQLSMSTRRAQYETLQDVTREVGRDVARFFFMQRSYQAQLDFDLDLAKKQTSDNPVFYVQYAHARIHSLASKVCEEKGFQERWPEYNEKYATLLGLPEEIELTKMLLSYPDVIKRAAAELAPHKVTHYVLELARQFQSYYDRARQDEKYKVLFGDAQLIQAKLFFLGCVRQVIKNSLLILGVHAPDRM